MTRSDDTIEQLRFLAENWHRFSHWTRIQIIVTIWWFVKIQRPLRRMAKRHGLQSGSQRRSLAWLLVISLFCLSFIGLAATFTQVDPQLSLLLALLSAGFLASLVLLQNRKR
jgi:hypothetical protein